MDHPDRGIGFQRGLRRAYAAAVSNRRVSRVALVRAFVTSHLIFAPVAAAGLWLGRRLGLGAPLLEALANGLPFRISPVAAFAYCAAGAGLAVLLWALDMALFRDARSAFATTELARPAPWLRSCAVLYGAVAEEVLMRLGILTIVAAVIAAPLGLMGQSVPVTAIGPAVVVSAAAFGLGHLPATARVTRLNRSVVLRSLILNGLAGLVFGTLYAVSGLEAAMIAHASTDLMIQFGLPLLDRR